MFSGRNIVPEATTQECSETFGVLDLTVKKKTLPNNAPAVKSKYLFSLEQQNYLEKVSPVKINNGLAYPS